VSDGLGFKKLTAWQRADELASMVFHAAQQLPQQHRWLASQMMRAAISVPANVAEGHGRGSLAGYRRFLDIARGSLSEVEYYLHFAGKEGLVRGSDVREIGLVRAEAGRLLHRLWLSLKSKSSAEWDHSGSMIREVSDHHYEASD